MCEYDHRLRALQDALAAAEAAAAVIAATDSMRYLTGWSEPPGERMLALWVPGVGSPSFVAPALYADDVRRNPAGVTDIRVWHDSEGWTRSVGPLLAACTQGSSVLVDDELSAVHLLKLQQMAPDMRWLAAGPVIGRLREVKSSTEVGALSRSAAMADTVYRHAVGEMRVGMTERDLQDLIMRSLASYGASSSWAIVCFGANSAFPHHRTGSAALRAGDVVVLDLGGCLDGYQSDITRTVRVEVAGSAPARRTTSDGAPKPETAYRLVYDAHMAALRAAKPGVSCESVDRAARELIEHRGYGDRFVHRTGHGIGLSTHEHPYIVAGNARPLREGMCFSVEPGVYFPGSYGVRIENIVTVTGDGSRSLNASPPPELPTIEVPILQ